MSNKMYFGELKKHLTLVSSEEDNKSLILQLKQDNLPVILWGAGSMSYSTRNMLKHAGVMIEAIWVDGERNVDSIDGIPVMDYPQIATKYKYFDVVCGHSRFDLVETTENEREQIHRIFCFVNICYGQWKGITTKFINEHIREYEESCNLFSDNRSKECFAAYLNCRNNENYRYLIPVCNETASYFRNPFFQISSDETYLDVGAYDGDTIREFLEASQRQYKKIIAIEPEKRSCEKLVRYIKKDGLSRVEVYDNGCWNEDTVLHFSLSEESSSISEDSKDGVDLHVRRLDEQFSREDISLIKINFLNGVYETLRGAEGILQADNKPNLAITVGFDEWGLIRIPKVIKDLNPAYQLGLRYASPMPARLIMFAY